MHEFEIIHFYDATGTPVKSQKANTYEIVDDWVHFYAGDLTPVASYQAVKSVQRVDTKVW